jgi:N-acetylglucosamine malate deacetylase 1
VELNCGGTVIKFSKAGYKTGIIDLTKAELSTRGNLKSRSKETFSANKILGIRFRENLKIRDGNIENSNTNRLKIIRMIRKYKPEIIFAPYPHDRHPDHINASYLIRDAAFYSGLLKIKTPGLKEHRPKKIFYYRSAYEMPVSFIVDISNEFNDKLKAIDCYSSQFFNKNSKAPETYISSKIFKNGIEARARYYGLMIGVEFGEPFFSFEPFKLDNKILFDI